MLTRTRVPRGVEVEMTSNAFGLTINGQRVELETVGAHLKRPRGAGYADYCLDIPLEIAAVIFGTRKPDAVAWADYAREVIDRFGTLMIDGCLTDLTRLANKKRGPLEGSS